MKERLDDVEINAILSGGRENIDRYLVTTVHALRQKVDDWPDMLAEAIVQHQSSCRADSRKRIVAIASAIGGAIGIATPYLIQLF